MKTKLKPDRVKRLAIWFVIVAVLTTALTVAEDELFGTRYITWFYGALFLVFGYLFYRIIYVQSRAIRFGILLLYVLIGTAAWHYELANHMDTFLSEKTYAFHLGLFLGLAFVLIPFMLINRSKVKTRFRKLFELSAAPVEDHRAGYSSRPYPVGKQDYSLQEIRELGKYLERKMIAVPLLLDDRVLLCFSAGQGMMQPDPEKSSYVSFDESGNVTVSLKRDDYHAYRDRLSFEELCQSMASLFLSFLDLYRSGDEKEILRKVDSGEPAWMKYALIAGVILLLALVSVSVYYWLANAS